MSMVNPLAEYLELNIVLSSQAVTIVLTDIVGTENHKRQVLAAYCTPPPPQLLSLEVLTELLLVSHVISILHLNPWNLEVLTEVILVSCISSILYTPFPTLESRVVDKGASGVTC